MSEKADSVRVTATKKMLRSALIQLLMEKPIQNITVRELCERAQIHRGTFYLHYTDIQTMMASIEADMAQTLKEALGTLDEVLTDARKLVGPCREIFRFLKKNSDMCVFLLGPNTDFKFMSQLLEMGREYSLKKYMECYPQVTRRQAEYFYSFVSAGCIGILRQWMENDFSDPVDAMAVQAEQFIFCTGMALRGPIEFQKEGKKG